MRYVDALHTSLLGWSRGRASTSVVSFLSRPHFQSPIWTMESVSWGKPRDRARTFLVAGALRAPRVARGRRGLTLRAASLAPPPPERVIVETDANAVGAKVLQLVDAAAAAAIAQRGAFSRDACVQRQDSIQVNSRVEF